MEQNPTYHQIHQNTNAAAGILMLPSDMPAQDLDDARSCVDQKNPTDLSSLEFCKEIGEGGFGKVILASDPVSEERLAVKIMDKSRCKEEKIYTEVEVLRMTAGCHYLISLRAFRETPNEYLIAMDYMARGNLFDHMAHWMPFDIETTRLFAAEMVCGLQFLHEHGIIH